MQRIELKNINLGGIADSDYLGPENSVAEAVNLDLHSEAGVIKVNQKLTKDSGSTVDDLVLASIPCSNGSTYHFGSTNGKIWERTSGGTWTLRGTVAPAAGSVGVLDAKEYQGYIYIATQSRLARFAIVTADTAITLVNNWATFTNTDASFHPMEIVNLVLYIGDGKYLAQVSGVTFSANVLDIASPLRIKCLKQIPTGILIGTYVADNINSTQVIMWNTWSVSFSTSDPIPEVGVNSFLDIDNNVILNAGTKGNLYVYNGSSLEQIKTVKGVYTSTGKAFVHPNAKLNFNNFPLFGVSNVTGNPCLLGVYSFNRTNRNYPYILNLEYTLSQGNTSNIEIGAICRISSDQFSVSWKDTTSGTVYGVDVLDLTAKATSAYFTTRVTILQRERLSHFGIIDVGYRSLPTNTDIQVFKKANSDSSFGSAITAIDDTIKMTKSTTVTAAEATRLQVKISLVSSANTAPEVEMMVLTIA